jgi:signal transduction histidine kinase
MAGRLAHELRTPVAVVRSSLDNLNDAAVPADARVYIDRARSGLARLNAILTRMTEATRLEEALHDAERERFDLALVVAGCVEGYRLAYRDVPIAFAPPAHPSHRRRARSVRPDARQARRQRGRVPHRRRGRDRARRRG